MAVETPMPGHLRRFSVAEYHQMQTAGILGEDDRVELIDFSKDSLALVQPISIVAAAVELMGTVFLAFFVEYVEKARERIEEG